MALVLNSNGAITASSEDIDFGATTSVTAAVYKNANSSTDDFTIDAGDNAMIIGPFTAEGNITVNGTLTIV